MTKISEKVEAVIGDNDYKWGVIYYNTSDTRIVVPKKHGIGWTLNVGHPAGQLGLVLAVGAVIVPMVMHRKVEKSRTDKIKDHLKDLNDLADLKKLRKMVKM